MECTKKYEKQISMNNQIKASQNNEMMMNDEMYALRIDQMH